ncbi:DUF3604 domain-containing protein [Oceanicoccus sagamiensis]|uniref:DUF3604 domain-containing protein n=1 Tax=Oceanicoccus sagamiensis TaxID=716816 RepID=A0A1X9N8C8_9GAMM|nr:DUF3604 domain-containing protein [Oceanicoccus sagamiensis]ARN74320.1 hypothetical protein BST96_09400 [Oceanicoccus sagamiensis]
MITRKSWTLAAAISLATSFSAASSEGGLTEAEKNYSPYAQSTMPRNVYWGDSHLHTGLSLDAGLFGNTLRPDAAWRFAKGEEVVASTGVPVKLARPLDWMVLTDHSDMMGIATDIKEGTDNIMAVPKGKEYHEAFVKGGSAAGEAAFDLIQSFSQMTVPKQFLEDYSPGSEVFGKVWEEIVNAAEEHNEPGLFTAFIGYEWTSVPKGFNLHRNVIFRDNADKALQMQPAVTQAPKGSTDPKDLYKWLEAYEQKTGGRVFAFSHNGNLSNGWMFPTETTYHGGVVDKEFVEQRAKWEPHYEITQIKGDGETHPTLSPDDEFADYENWDVGNLDISELKKPEMLKGEYGREALKQGLMLEKKFGTNPYKFGIGGATDSHTSLATADEDNFFGKSTSVEPSASRIAHPFIKNDMGEIPGYKLVASGYTGIWSHENTRTALYDAMERKETYATTGPRMTVRFFGGWDYDKNDVYANDAASIGYAKGVPMGGDLVGAKGKAPNFMITASKDPMSGNLDRIQVVKGWMDKAGKLHERVYDVAVSDGRKIKNGRATKSVGNTVDLKTATWSNSIGDAELATVWTDPDFDKAESSFYYVRVLEIPTPRWVLYDKVRMGAKVPKEAELVGQERAYTSPIWYSPK